VHLTQGVRLYFYLSRIATEPILIYPYVREATMKILLKVVGAIVACAILALAVFSITGLDPNQRRAGLWLKGDVETFPADWAFADKYQTLLVETHPWYGIAHSVTIYFVTDQGNLYLHASYAPGGKWPDGKTWTAYLAQNPKVRVKLGNEVFDGKIAPVTDPAVFNACHEAFRKRYPQSPYSADRRIPDQQFLRVLSE
jgi:hypothetical protein